MDLVSSCKDKLAYFRIKELKDVLAELCLARQGKKQELVDRILFVLSDEKVAKVECRGRKYPIGREGIAKIIDETYRKMQIHGVSNIASTRQGDSHVNPKVKEENGGSLQLAMKVRCPCGNSLPAGQMIQCNDPKCGVLQHFSCVIIPEKAMEGEPPDLPQFYCEICRLSRADPFWVTVEHLLLPVKLTNSELQSDGTNPMQSVGKIFQLRRTDFLQKPEYEVQAWCILLNDRVPFRMQWPQFSDLQVNGLPIRTTNRPGSQLLGANGRDDGALITTYTREGINNISLSGCDARVFCFGVRIGKRCTVQEVLDKIPKEQDGERFEDALARVFRCIGGGNAAEDADSDSDLEVVADSVTINLRCPMSGSRIKTAGRFKPCAHMGCFDLETFVELNQRSRKWQCPICLKNYTLENVIIDPYFNRITTKMLDCGEDVTEIDVKPDGSWRAKNENEQLDLAQWHLPDGSLCTAMDKEVTPVLEASKHVKQEELYEDHWSLRLGIRKDSTGIWEVKPEDMNSLSSDNYGQGGFQKNCPRVMLMSSSATVSYRDGEDPSVNQDGGGHFDLSANYGTELDSISLNFDQNCGLVNRGSSALVGNADVIVLSDSDEEQENFIPPANIHDSGQAGLGGSLQFSVPTEIHNFCVENPSLVTGRNSLMGLLHGNGDVISMWPSTSSTQGGPEFQLFQTEPDVSNSFLDVPQTSIACSTSMNAYILDPDTAMACAVQVPLEHSVPPNNADMNDGALVDNPMGFGGDDPSLRLFLPSQPAGTSIRSDFGGLQDMSNSLNSDNWISLRLGGGDDGNSINGQVKPASSNGLSSGHQYANEAPLLRSMNENMSDSTFTKRQRSESPFRCPHQPSSARPRLYLSIDSDTE